MFFSVLSYGITHSQQHNIIIRNNCVWSVSGICSGLHHSAKNGLCHLCYHTIEGDHKVKNKERYWICPKYNLKTQLRFSIWFCKTNLKVIKFVMMLYCFTELNIRNTQKTNKASLPHKNEDYELFSCGH